MLKYDYVAADAVGTTASTPEEIGTIQLLPEAKEVKFVLVQGANTGTSTTAEATSGKININWRSLCADQWELPIGIGSGGLGATNHNGRMDPGKLVPYNMGEVISGKGIGNARITFHYEALHPEPTADMAAQAFLAYSVGSVPDAVLANRGMAIAGGLKSKIGWTDFLYDDAIGTATSEAVDRRTCTVPSRVTRVVAFGQQFNQDAVSTAGEHVLGRVQLGGTMQGLDPMYLPLQAKHASLGTAQNNALEFGEIIYPFYVEPPSNADVTFTGTAQLQQVTSGDNQIITSFYGF